MNPIPIALVGLGKIAADQHVPAISISTDFTLAAVASRNATLDGVDHFSTLEALLAARPDIEAVALCMPPSPRFQLARTAIAAGKHVLLEKPPGATVAEVLSLEKYAATKGVTLFATWHSRHAAAVEPARKFLGSVDIFNVTIDWKEDVRHWHPKQRWIWEPGGLGVFDPGINALSILTRILPGAVFLTQAELEFPENQATPIGASLRFASEDGYRVNATFDWRQTGPQTWDITVATSKGLLKLAQGGTVLTIDGKPVDVLPKPEYHDLYDRFAHLIRTGSSDVDVEPLQHVADAFMLAKRRIVSPFVDD